MKNEIISANTLLANKRISLLDAVRLICNALDALPKNSTITPIQFCAKIIETGKRHIRVVEKSVEEGFKLYLATKSGLRKESFSDIYYLGKRFLNANTELAKRNFSEISVVECENCIANEFTTPSQFNKARTMLHGLFEFALHYEWCDKNPVKFIKRRKIIEKEIVPLKLGETKRLLRVAESKKNGIFTPAVGVLIYAGIRPCEVKRIKWHDIDLEENTITIRSICSKTGGVRQVEICPVLKKILQHNKTKTENLICPPNWDIRWRAIRDESGFKGIWVQDVLRHTYASFYAKHFSDLLKLQLNMGHRDLSLLRSRYINMYGISKQDAKTFFETSN